MNFTNRITFKFITLLHKNRSEMLNVTLSATFNEDDGSTMEEHFRTMAASFLAFKIGKFTFIFEYTELENITK